MNEIKELKAKIKLAKELLELLEKIEKLQEPKRECIPYPEPYPYPYPNPWPWIITYPYTTGKPILKDDSVIS